MSRTMPIGEVTVTCVVALPPAESFASFTSEIDRWWVGDTDSGEDAVVRFEGDRLVMATSDGVQDLATVRSWEPSNRIEMGWHGPHAEPGDVVVVEFEADPGGTRITIRHRRDGIRPADVVAAVVGLWWGELIRAVASAQRKPGEDN